jgi:DNA-binding NarL/FixJ family response regulator
MISKTQKSAGSAEKKKVFVVDDHPIMREGIAQLINQSHGYCVCGEADDAAKALLDVESCRPDIVIADLSLGKTSGFTLLENLKVRHDDLPVLVLSMHDEAVYAERVVRLGAKGYLMKSEGPAKVMEAIERILAGEIYVSEKIKSRMLQKLGEAGTRPLIPSVESLSNRELEVFKLLGEGLETQQIADVLALSVKTVEAHIAHLKEKLDLKTSRELLVYAVRWLQTEA